MSEVPWQSTRNIVTREQLRDALNQYSREPFGDVLEALLQARPSDEEMTKWARKDPAQWANAIKIFALLNGYTEKTESTTIHKHLHLHKLSDAELLQEAQKMIDSDPGLLEDLKSIHNRADTALKIEHNQIPPQQPAKQVEKIDPFLDE